MSKVKLDILKNGGSIYYTDTDSIVTNKPLPEALVGSALGQFKLEHVADIGYFISNNTYFLQLKYGGTVVIAKGTKGSYLNMESFIRLYAGQDLDTFRTKSNINLSEGYVNIVNNNKVTLSWDSFKKREKVYVNLRSRDGLILNQSNIMKILKQRMIQQLHSLLIPLHSYRWYSRSAAVSHKQRIILQLHNHLYY